MCQSGYPYLCGRSKRWSCTRAKEAHTAGAYPGFCSMKQLRVLLLPPGRDASPLQGYPQQYVASTHSYTWVERDTGRQSILSKETTRWQGLGVKPSTFRPSVQRAHHYTTPPPTICVVCTVNYGQPYGRIIAWSQQSVHQTLANKNAIHE